ncbi:7556_t:CDS:2, partial [Ambispora leptoticha]
MEEEYGNPGSSSSTSAGHNQCDYVDKSLSTNSAFIINKNITKTEEGHKANIDRAKELMKDLRDPSNLISFKYLVEDLEIEPSSAPLLKLLVDALLLL